MFLSISCIQKAIENKQIVVTDTFDGALNGMTIDVRLGSKILVPNLSKPLDPLGDSKQINWLEHELPKAVKENKGKGFLLPQNTLCLAHTLEKVSIGNQIFAMINSRSTAARVGLVVHQSAPLIHPGSGIDCEGIKPRSITLELSTTLPKGILLYSGLRIAQLKFGKISSALEKGYDCLSFSEYSSDDCVMKPNYGSLV